MSCFSKRERKTLINYCPVGVVCIAHGLAYLCLVQYWWDIMNREVLCLSSKLVAGHGMDDICENLRHFNEKFLILWEMRRIMNWVVNHCSRLPNVTSLSQWIWEGKYLCSSKESIYSKSWDNQSTKVLIFVLVLKHSK